MLDNISFFTFNQQVINDVVSFGKDQLDRQPNEKGWRSTDIFSNGNGIYFYFHRNRFGERDKMYIRFSPHVQANGGLHNASFFTYKEAQKSIVNTFANVGIARETIKEFGINAIEIGTNFRAVREPYFVLNSALMFGRYFFKTHEKHRHYRYATTGEKKRGSKYFTTKFYIKSEQIDGASGLTYHQLNYCGSDVMRFEVKIERTDKFKFFDFSNAENLFNEEAEEVFSDFLLKNYDRMFFFSIKEIEQRRIKTKAQLRHLFRWEEKNFWQQLRSDRIKDEKIYYQKQDKKFDIKAEVFNAISNQLQRKNTPEIPTKTKVKTPPKFLPNFMRVYMADFPLFMGYEEVFCNPYHTLDVGKRGIFFTSLKDRKKFCLVTGLDISMQRKESKVLCNVGIKYYQLHHPLIFDRLKKLFVPNVRDAGSKRDIVYRIGHNIRNCKRIGKVGLNVID